MKSALKHTALILLANLLCWPLLAKADQNVLILSSVNRLVPWQGSLERGVLERAQEIRFNAPRTEHAELYFASVDWFRKVPERSLEEIAEDVIDDFEGLTFEKVIVIGQPASHVFELAQKGLGNPSAEYVDTSWVSEFGLDSEGLHQPELVYQSLRNLYPSMQRLIYLGSNKISYQDEVDFDEGAEFEFVARNEFDSHSEWDAFRSELGAGDLVLVDSSMQRIGLDLHFPYQVVSEIAQRASVPILVTQASMLELEGVLGGVVVDSFQLGHAVADIAEGNTPDPSQLSHEAYNYSELERFGFNVAALGSDVEILGEPVYAISAEKVQGYLLLGMIGFAAFGWAWLTRERRRSRKLSEASARNSELYAELEQRQRNAGLALDAAQIAHYSYEHSTGVFNPDKRFQRLYGVVAEADFDLSVLEQQIHPEDLVRVLAFRQQAYAHFNSDEDFSINYRIRPQGSQEYIWLKAFARQYLIDDECWTLGCIFSVDAEMKAKEMYELASDTAEQALQDLELTTSLGGIALMRHDLATDRLTVNDVFRRLFDFPCDEYPSIYFDDFCSRFPAENRERDIAAALQARFELEVNLPSACFELRDGSKRWVRVQLKTQFSYGEPTSVFGSFVDISELRKLSGELREIAAQRQAALESLERRQQAQQQMFAVIGHELRTPAATLSMLLDSQRAELTDEEVRVLPYAKDIDATAKHLMDVLDDLRAVVEPQSINFRTRNNATPLDVVEGCLTPLRDLLKTANLWVQINSVQGAAEPFSFDAKGMRQIITNLVKNAASHSGASELKLGLLLELNDEAQKQLRVELADNGKGIPGEQWESIFEPFERGLSFHCGFRYSLAKFSCP